MLKLTYHESNLHLERLSQSPEAFVACRGILALRLGQPYLMEPGRAAFLLPANHQEFQHLQALLETEASDGVSSCIVDTEFGEVSVRGTWIAANPEAEAGVFITVLSPPLEALVVKLWQLSQSQVSFRS